MIIKHNRPLLLTFAFVSALLVIFAKKMEVWGIDSEVVLIGNIVVFGVTLAATLLLTNGLKAKHTSGFIQMVYASLLVKMLLCAIAALVYIRTAATVNKPAIFILMGLYLLYTTMEVKLLQKVTKAIKENAERKSTV